MTRTAQAKRPHESHWQWHSRLALLRQQERDREQPLVTPEAMRQAEYVDEFVMHVETGTKVQTKRRRDASAIEALHESGRLSNHQLEAAQNIAKASRAIRGEVQVRCSSVEARVDCSGSATQHLIEHIRAAHLARAYRRWWSSGTRVPRAMLLEMIIEDRGLKAIARRHRVGWPRAMRMLGEGLDSFNGILENVMREIDERDLDAAHKRLARAA